MQELVQLTWVFSRSLSMPCASFSMLDISIFSSNAFYLIAYIFKRTLRENFVFWFSKTIQTYWSIDLLSVITFKILCFHFIWSQSFFFLLEFINEQILISRLASSILHADAILTVCLRYHIFLVTYIFCHVTFLIFSLLDILDNPSPVLKMFVFTCFVVAMSLIRVKWF